MKIEKFSKQKNGMYLLVLEDGNKIKIHEDLILKYELLLRKKLDAHLLEKIYQENQIYEVYAIALKYLNTRLRSRKELQIYLSRKGFSVEVIDSVLKILEEQSYLNDLTYATSYVHDRILMSNFGPNKIRAELVQNGISSEIIEQVLLSFNEELENERIQKLVEKQIKQNHNKGAMLLKGKIYSYLLNLGYSSLLINQNLNGKKLVDDDISKKEYEKLYIKLSKKYSGRELEYKLKQKMYQKGFTNFNEE